MFFFLLLYLKEAPGRVISLLYSYEKLQKTDLTLTSLFSLLLYKCLNKDPKYFNLYLTQAQPLYFRVYLVIYFFFILKTENCLFVNPFLQAGGFLIVTTSESSTLRQILSYLVWSSYALGKPAKPQFSVLRQVISGSKWENPVIFLCKDICFLNRKIDLFVNLQVVLYRKAFKKLSKYEPEQEMFGKTDWKAGETALEDLSGWRKVTTCFPQNKTWNQSFFISLKKSQWKVLLLIILLYKTEFKGAVNAEDWSITQKESEWKNAMKYSNTKNKVLHLQTRGGKKLSVSVTG